MTGDERTVVEAADVRTIDLPGRDVGPWHAARLTATVEENDPPEA
jgi:hypothetical protein